MEIVYEVSGEADLVALVHVDDTMARFERCWTKCGWLHPMKSQAQPLNWSWSSIESHSSSLGGE